VTVPRTVCASPVAALTAKNAGNMRNDLSLLEMTMLWVPVLRTAVWPT
jgi:hypothetical protein